MLVFLLAAVSIAQPDHRERGKNWNKDADRPNATLNLPDLSEEQIDKIKDLRTANMKIMLDLRNQTQEKRARLKTLQSADKPDMNTINATIDEIAVLQAKKGKTHAAHRQEIRSILTDDQRVIFDSRPMCKRFAKQGFGKGLRGRNNGECPRW
jgi:Spy/CpxP family protein refolding chaperone